MIRRIHPMRRAARALPVHLRGWAVHIATTTPRHVRGYLWRWRWDFVAGVIAGPAAFGFGAYLGWVMP